MLHLFCLACEPEQLFPPQEGVGLLHLLVNVCIPPPHVLLHDPYVHELHPPSTIYTMVAYYKCTQSS